jgi:two-component system, NarL family, response regulator LiaR
MRKTIVLYGGAMAVLLALLKFIEYRYYVLDLPTELYIGTVALLFTFLGAWIGWNLTRRRRIVLDPNFVVNEEILEQTGISKREYEVLELIAQGLSNKEISEKLFVSTNTIKTHSSNLFRRLNARRRTEAVKRAKELRLLP